MTALQIIALDKDNLQLRAPALGDTYDAPRELGANEGLRVSGGESLSANYFGAPYNYTNVNLGMFNPQTHTGYAEAYSAIVSTEIDMASSGAGSWTSGFRSEVGIKSSVADPGFFNVYGVEGHAHRNKASDAGTVSRGIFIGLLGVAAQQNVPATCITDSMKGGEIGVTIEAGRVENAVSLEAYTRATGSETTIDKLTTLLVSGAGVSLNSATIGEYFGIHQDDPDAKNVFESNAFILPNLPTSDPSVAGQLWNDSGTLKISAG